MATLTKTEAEGFTPEQLVPISKMPDSRLVPPAHYETSEAEHRADVLGKWARKTPLQLRALYCFGTLSAGVFTWSSECDLTPAQMESAQDLLSPGVKAIDVIVDVIGGKRSIEQRLAALGG